jgi:alanine racemase
MAEARIDLTQLARNIRTTQDRLGDCRLLFPVKANAYGHGALELARVAQQLRVDYLGVANLAEALELRQAGIETPILIFSASRVSHIPQLIESNVDITLSSPTFADALNDTAKRHGRRVRVQIKVDTGMGRNGIWWENAIGLTEQVANLSQLEFTGIFTHFSTSYSTGPEEQTFTRDQITSFNQLLDELDQRGILPPLRHIANSSGLVQYEDEVTTGHFNMVRPGILLYGEPEVRKGWTDPIKPILSMNTWITSISELPKGRYIGYGRNYQTDTTRRIATLPVGYADGVSWWLKNAGEVLIHGHRAPVVGGISMDQITVDVTDVPNLNVDDEVNIIHPDLPAIEIAQTLGASFSEIVLTALSKRVVRTYVNAPTPCSV